MKIFIFISPYNGSSSNIQQYSNKLKQIFTIYTLKGNVLSKYSNFLDRLAISYSQRSLQPKFSCINLYSTHCYSVPYRRPT